MPQRKRQRVLRLWLSDAEKAMLERLAAAAETTQSDLVRDLIRRAERQAAKEIDNDAR